MNSKAKVVDQEMQDEMIGVLTAISIVSKRLASRLLKLGERHCEEKSTSPPENGSKG